MEPPILLSFFLLFMAGLFFTWFFAHRARAKERLLLIEKGIDLSSLPKSGNFKIYFPWLKLGIVITSISTGCLLSFLLISFNGVSGDKAGGLVIILLFLFGGIGMILAHFLDKPKEQK